MPEVLERIIGRDSPQLRLPLLPQNLSPQGKAIYIAYTYLLDSNPNTTTVSVDALAKECIERDVCDTKEDAYRIIKNLVSFGIFNYGRSTAIVTFTQKGVAEYRRIGTEELPSSLAA